MKFNIGDIIYTKRKNIYRYKLPKYSKGVIIDAFGDAYLIKIREGNIIQVKERDITHLEEVLFPAGEKLGEKI